MGKTVGFYMCTSNYRTHFYKHCDGNLKIYVFENMKQIRQIFKCLHYNSVLYVNEQRLIRL